MNISHIRIDEENGMVYTCGFGKDNVRVKLPKKYLKEVAVALDKAFQNGYTQHQKELKDFLQIPTSKFDLEDWHDADD